MYDYVKPSLTGTESSIVRPTIAANNFELKPNTIQMIQQFVQFDGLQDEDPNTHLANFLEFCDTFKINGVSDDAISLQLFPFSLTNKTKQWLHSLPLGSITTWDQMTKKILLKYFPPAKTAKLRNDISSFVQIDSETLYDAWERYKDLLRRCPHHGLPLWLHVQTFYNATGGTLNKKTPKATHEFIEEMSLNNYQWQVTRTMPAKAAGVFNVDAVTALANQVELLHKKFDSFCGSSQAHPVMQCDASEGVVNPEYPPYGQGMESEQMNYMANNFHSNNNPYSNTYNSGWKNHPNFSWGGQRNQRQQPSQNFQQQPYPQEKKANLEEKVETKLEALSQEFKDQFGQLAKQISERPQGRLPNNTETNPREQVQAVTAQDSEGLDEPNLKQKNVVEEDMVEDNKKSKPVIKDYKPRIPYPQAITKDDIEEQFGKFLKLLKKLHINLSFLEALSQMPDSRKFLKKLLTNKRQIDEESYVELNIVCSAMLQNKLPQKLKDLGSFTIPCLIGSLSIDNALTNLGASINVMPYKLFKQLGLGKPKQTRMSIQLPDKTIRVPRGIIEDVLVKIDKFVFPVDFVVLDMDEDNTIPLILGRPFLATARTKIDVDAGELILCSVFKPSIKLEHRITKETPQHDPSPKPYANKEITHEEQGIQIDE
ncbi:Integrase, catalytic core [Gossypium australe]|uniref:Integrase, catalytic core n=1 Tax=Gossypium australe TaxID=47621 RepID=A0A5B6VUK3_9ROSI|nr:Integrase, catalytic core [Gossypium australe]